MKYTNKSESVSEKLPDLIDLNMTLKYIKKLGIKDSTTECLMKNDCAKQHNVANLWIRWLRQSMCYRLYWFTENTINPCLEVAYWP